MSARPQLHSVPAAPRFGVAVRVSRVMGRSGEQFHSPATQEAGARRAIEAFGGVVAGDVGADGVFFDLDVSGAIAPSDRPGLGEALELVRAGRLAGVAVYDLSRWSRETVGGLRELEQVAAIGGHVLSGSETIDLETPAGRFSTTVQLAAHQMRRDEASRAWRATHQSRHERGLPHGKVPMGYLPDGRGGVMIDSALADAITAAFADYAADRVTQVQIAERLTELRGRLTRPNVISRLLRNPFFTGVVNYRGDTRQGRHERLVTPEVFEQVQQRLATDKHAGSRTRGPVSCLAGLAFCGVCGLPLHRRGRGAVRKNGDVIPMLKCSGMPGGCEGIGAPRVAELERVVRDHVLDLAGGLRDGTAEYAARSARASRARSTIAQLRAERQGLTESLGRAGGLLARGVMTETAYRATADDLEQQLLAVQARLRDAERQERAAGAEPAELASAADRIRQFWTVMTPQERRADLRVFVDRVLVDAPAYRGQPVGERVRYPEHEET